MMETVCQHCVELQGRLLRRLGIGWSLAAVPAISAILMAATAIQPTVLTVGIADVLRKVRHVIVHALALVQPTVEVLRLSLSYRPLCVSAHYSGSACACIEHQLDNDQHSLWHRSRVSTV